jgi:signal transduction histidine kinase
VRTRRLTTIQIRSAIARYAVPAIACVCSAGAGAGLQAALGYRFPLITFYPAVILSAWFGGLWPGIVATILSSALVDYLWLAPLRAAGSASIGDPVALVLFVAIGLAISGFSESLHRSTAREHHARQRAEERENALKHSEHQLRLALTGEHTARADAEAANRLKDQFLAMVSHELRTPLNALLGWSDMLKHRMVDDNGRDRAIDAIHANAKRQAQLVDDLLDIAGMMSGKLQLRRSPVDVTELVRAAVDIVQPTADAKSVELAFDADAPVGLLNGDGIRLQQVFWNLLSNAIKFTPEHGVVRVRLRPVDEAIELIVSDTGQGIPSVLLRSIFEPFHQADTSTTRVHGGLGLGLSIVKHIVEAHGGAATAESAGDGRGATFIVRLPTTAVGETPARPASQAPTSAIPNLLSGLCVLVVDDDASSREVVARLLEYHDATALTAASGERAFEILLRRPVHALLVDIAMPDQDGYVFIRRLRESPSPIIASIPAAAITAMVADEDRERAMQAGFQLHVAKPVDSATLVRTVASLARSAQIPT